MNRTKIHLSADELALIQNGQLLLTKNAIIDKAVEMMGEMIPIIRKEMEVSGSHLPEEFTGSSPKISKGEKYEGLPWVMLDFPKIFRKDHVFAIRTMFWWGHYFSITLHLSGGYKMKLLDVLKRNKRGLSDMGFMVCISEDEWRHELSDSNYAAMEQLDDQLIDRHLSANDFCKLSVRIPLQMWNESAGKAETMYRAIFTALFP